jgi:hypothetical protein
MTLRGGNGIVTGGGNFITVMGNVANDGASIRVGRAAVFPSADRSQHGGTSATTLARVSAPSQQPS